MQSLFDNNIPLASRLRPTTIEDYVGQAHLIGEGKMLRRLIDSDNIPSIILWGPPGVGKTTLAQIISVRTQAEFVNFSAVSSGIKEVRTVMNNAVQMKRFGKKTIVFIDEIHRFNKAQQDAFLPYVENGSVILIGATTENPSFEVNSALLSRCKVFVLYALSVSDIQTLIRKVISLYRNDFGVEVVIDDVSITAISRFVNGDARIAYNTLEMVFNSANLLDNKIIVTKELVTQCIGRKFSLYDKNGEEHYNLISALHKSMRNSDVQASIYWLTRMLDAGEDPIFIARRVTRFASEDIGLADSNALLIAVSAYHACHFIGMPECSVHLTHAVTYCALAPKSNSLYEAYEKAMKDTKNLPSEPVPLALRNAPTQLMKELRYGEGYKYAHDFHDRITNMRCLPESISHHVYYTPSNQGRESKIKEIMTRIEEKRKNKTKNDN
jgi:putative ATPase